MNYELNKYYLQAILATVLAFAVTASASAQNPTTPQPLSGGESPDSVRQLYEVTVTSRQPVRTIATSQTMSGADLQALSTTSVADALKYFAGVQIKDYGGLGGLKTINVRSLGAQHVGVYIDGIRLTNAQNGMVDLGKFSLSSMESVSLYNANKLDYCQSASEYASGATVYLQTRRPTHDSLSVQLRNASFHTWMVKANGQFNWRGWQGFIDGEYCTSRGDYPFRYHSEYEDTVGRRANSDIRYGRIEGALFRGGFSSHIYYYDSERGCPGGIVRRLSDKYTNVGREWDRDFFVQASYQERFFDKLLFKANTKYTNEYLRYCTKYPENQNTARVDNHYRQQDVYGALCAAYMPWSWLSLSTSYDVRYSLLRADLKRFDDVKRLDQKQVIAAQVNWHDIQFAASALHQHYHDWTFANAGAADPLDRWTPAVSLAYTLYDITLRGWYKEIFRVPTLNDLYYTQVGNRNLKPEDTKQWNIGLEYHLSNSKSIIQNSKWAIDVQADAYINKIENRIVCLPLKGTYTWSMMNYGETFCRGLNATIKGHYQTGPWNFSLLTSFTWQRDVDRTDPDDEDMYDSPICYSPTFSTGVTAIAGWRSLQFTTSYLYVGERMWSKADPMDILEPYHNIDMKLQYNTTLGQVYGLFGGKRTASVVSRTGVGLCLEVCDVLDIQYEHLPRYPMPGRNYKLTLSFGI
ncbi:MAG: TonB-dependent receptor [Bacteroidaceae bacterium]|nr:TonB-dependent receptor [Bacteroidaceae bacterium]